MKKLFNLLLTSVICCAVVLGSVGCDKANYTQLKNDGSGIIASSAEAFATKLCAQDDASIENYSPIGTYTFVEGTSDKTIREGLNLEAILDGSFDLEVNGAKVKGSGNMDFGFMGSATREKLSEGRGTISDSNVKAGLKTELRFSSSATPQQIDTLIRALNIEEIASGDWKVFDILQENALYNALLNKDIALDGEAYLDNGLVLLEGVAKFGELNYSNTKIRYDFNDTYDNTELEAGETPKTFANEMGYGLVESIGTVLDTYGQMLVNKTVLEYLIADFITTYKLEIYMDTENLCLKVVGGSEFENYIKKDMLKLADTDKLKVNKLELVIAFNKDTKKLKNAKLNLDAEIDAKYSNGFTLKGNAKLNAEIKGEDVSVNIPSKDSYAVVTPFISRLMEF